MKFFRWSPKIWATNKRYVIKDKKLRFFFHHRKYQVPRSSILINSFSKTIALVEISLLKPLTRLNLKVGMVGSECYVQAVWACRITKNQYRLKEYGTKDQISFDKWLTIVAELVLFYFIIEQKLYSDTVLPPHSSKVHAGLRIRALRTSVVLYVNWGEINTKGIHVNQYV